MTPEANSRFGKKRLCSEIKLIPEGKFFLRREISIGGALRLSQMKWRFEFIFL